MIVEPAQLAQVNVARLRFPLDSPQVAEFVAALDRVNAIADRAPGFVWRLRDESDTHVSVASSDPRLIINLSVWQTYRQLHDFVYRSAHLRYLRRRSEWFEKIEAPATALWWISAGGRPSTEEALARLEYLRRVGPSPQAFTVRHRFTAAGERDRRGQGQVSEAR